MTTLHAEVAQVDRGGAAVCTVLDGGQPGKEHVIAIAVLCRCGQRKVIQ